MNRSKLVAAGLASAACLLASSTALSAEKLNIKPGLWEITSSTQMSGTPQLPKSVTDGMTPQQLAQLQADMKAASKDAKKNVDRSCITKKDVENPFHGASADCKQSIVQTTRTTQEVRLVCDGKTKGTGLIRINAPTPESMNGVMDMKMGDGSDTLNLKANLTGRWIGADCGEEGDADDDQGDEKEEAARPAPKSR
jgi:hypothetical protein